MSSKPNRVKVPEFEIISNPTISLGELRNFRIRSCPICKVRVSSLQEHCDRMSDEDHLALGIHET